SRYDVYPSGRDAPRAVSFELGHLLMLKLLDLPALPFDLPLLLLESCVNLPLADLMVLQFVADQRTTNCAETSADRCARTRGAHRSADNCARCSTKPTTKQRTLFASRQRFSRASNQRKSHCECHDSRRY